MLATSTKYRDYSELILVTLNNATKEAWEYLSQNLGILNAGSCGTLGHFTFFLLL